MFALLWENRIIAPVKPVKPRTRRKRRRRGEESDEEQEEVEKPVRVVDPDAWGLVEWLLDLWKRDREAYRVGHPGQREYLDRGDLMHLWTIPRRPAALQS